jgi:hypothetical protein
MFLPHHQQPLQEAIDELMAQNVGSEEEEEAWWIYNDLYTQSYSNQKISKGMFSLSFAVCQLV